MRSFAVADARIVAEAVCSAPPDGPERVFSALVDTGAQITSISRRVVETLRIEPVGTIPIVYASGDKQPLDEFWLHVGIPGLPHERFGAPVVRMELGSTDYDVILGMDVLARYHITIHNGLCTVNSA